MDFLTHIQDTLTTLLYLSTKTGNIWIQYLQPKCCILYAEQCQIRSKHF